MVFRLHLSVLLPCEWWGRRFLNHSNIETVLIKRQPGDSPRTTKPKPNLHYMGSNSHVETIKCGVPRGSVLEPLRFIVYTNDLPRCLNLTKSILFADDTTVYLSFKTYLYTTTNNELLNLTDWFRANKLSINISKTNYMLFTYHETPT